MEEYDRGPAMSVIVCGPAQGTKDKPYRCICCRRCFDDIEKLGVSICWDCQTGLPSCRRCRERGIFISDFRVGGYRKYRDTLRYYTGGGLGHRLRRLTRSTAIGVCGKRIPRKHLGDGAAVVPACKFCWPSGFGY